ncbi:MAG: ATP-binding cassette domain-containing protein [Anaerovoracaceae bacterium]|jgi:peptide/nickel transport system ATP-binding protein
MDELLRIENLKITFHGAYGTVPAVKGVSMSVGPGETVALVGESGCGKTALCRAVLRLHSAHAESDPDSRIFLCGRDVLRLSEDEMREVRGRDAAMVLQDPLSSLDPLFSIGDQIMEPMLLRGESRAAARERAVSLLGQVGIDRPEVRISQYPHEFSGGMRQRAAIAIALACDPKLIIADEPTTSLDSDIRDEIADLLVDIVKSRRDSGVGMLFITHDLLLARKMADRIIVMKDGLFLEEGTPDRIFDAPRSEYTRELIRYALDVTGGRHTHGGAVKKREGEEPLVTIRGLSKSYRAGRKNVNTVLRDLDLDIMKGEILGITGPSGSGKSTIAGCITGIVKPDRGTVDMSRVKNVQMIFQDSAEALDPRMLINEIIAEPLRIKNRFISRRAVEEAVLSVMEQVGLDPALSGRHPYDVSGGQRQRAAIARALITDPDLIIADEPTSSQDVSTQSQIVHLLKEIRDRRDLTMVMISHDLAMAVHICDRIMALSDMKLHETGLV